MKNTQLISIATRTQPVPQSKPMTVKDFLEMVKVTLSEVESVSVNCKRVTMEDMINPGDTVLVMTKIEGG
ncbi:hypothetical protein A2572_03620 [Candidatus Collierbacteria bacterium RIFOXYD1_FULL_40_9]|uniref:Ubiquitin Mut7-C domain-containing protein n=1 Tax=Candidatus Collierbacteria bacterium RIFOXYD1_FULL_40_9 TaxID=1817731 RepID=A0A1F5FTI3_9BACT|nr:MAG: hypothetical protein A2572_03620 [Candidatus Collierbacteria bacterium RIFOXYD1_FULL_40_9]